MKLILIIIIILIMVLRRVFKRELGKGEIGENIVNKKLESIKGYILLKDVLLKGDRGTTQIDHILVGPKGIFVIETKNYSGYIYGDEWSKEWTQALFGRRNKFYNPIRQNYGHIKAVEKHLGKNERKYIYSIVVFGDDCKLKKIKSETPVIYVRKLKRYIKKFKCEEYLSRDEIEIICKKIDKGNIQKNRVRRKHIKRVKKLNLD